MTSAPAALRRTSKVGLSVAAALVFAACGGGDKETASAQGQGSGDAAKTQEVSFALDWTPNTNHIGVYVADELGYYRDAGIEPKILPYASSPADTLVNNGKADFGITGQANTLMGRAAGSQTVSVFAVVQKETGSLITLGDRKDLERPRDLDGKTYGGFGDPWSATVVEQMIRDDGGKGDFENATLTTAAYEALKEGKVDFTQDIQTWEGIQAEIEGRPYKRWQYADYGVPRTHTTIIASSDKFLEEEPDLARKFIEATQRGYEYAADKPREAAKILIEANPDLGKNEELVYKSAEALAEDGYLKGADGEVGTNQPQMWNELGDFMFEKGLLVDEDGKKLTEKPKVGDAYTNELLSSQQ